MGVTTNRCTEYKNLKYELSTLKYITSQSGMTVRGLFANFILLSDITNKPSSSNTALKLIFSRVSFKTKILESKPLTVVLLTDIVHFDVLSSYSLNVLTLRQRVKRYHLSEKEKEQYQSDYKHIAPDLVDGVSNVSPASDMYIYI